MKASLRNLKNTYVEIYRTKSRAIYSDQECQIPLHIMRNRFEDSFLTILCASETSASASFSMCFIYPECTIFFLALWQLVSDIKIDSNNFLFPEFPSSGSSNFSIKPTFSSFCTNRFRFLCFVFRPPSLLLH